MLWSQDLWTDNNMCRAIVGGTAGTAMAVPLFGPITIFNITHLESSFPLFYYFLSFYFFLLSNRNKIEQEKVKQRLFYRDGLCWNLVWYANSWNVMESALCHEMFTWSLSVMLRRSIFLSISGIQGVYAISATFCSLFSSVSK